MKTTTKDIEFLEAYLQERQKIFETAQELCPYDFHPSDDTLPKTDEKAKRVARLADENGFDGNLFRDLIPEPDNKPFGLVITEAISRLEKQIETIPKIISAIEAPPDRSIIPDGAELINIPQLAGLLQWGESVVRQRDKEGLLPTPLRNGGTIQWRRKEILEWIDAGCPIRQVWERTKKQREGVV